MMTLLALSIYRKMLTHAFINCLQQLSDIVRNCHGLSDIVFKQSGDDER